LNNSFSCLDDESVLQGAEASGDIGVLQVNVSLVKKKHEAPFKKEHIHMPGENPLHEMNKKGASHAVRYEFSSLKLL
jgi:hypothetical protein